MNVTLNVQNQSLPLGFQALSQVIYFLPDDAEFQPLFDTLAKHPSAQVRSAIAQKEHLSESTIQDLGEDASISVLRALVHNRNAQANLETEIVLEMIRRDAEVAETIAANLECWNDRKRLFEGLVQHSDPLVRWGLARNPSTPRNLICQLLSDKDPEVSDGALKSLG